MSSMSKRAQARTEKELHDLLRTPGNSTCADCGAKNPVWASWNLGVFLCMRCASIHRKLGTHISKVKSLSMDTWTNEQLETMKRNGNLAVNKIYNPKNKRPDMPLDADEVDSAMERFIRKKYQEKSLSDGRPEVPIRDEVSPARPRSPDFEAPPQLPVKKGRFFGFGLRASSSAYPLSKHDKKHRNQQGMDGNSRIASENYTSRSSSAREELSDSDLQVKLAQLNDMGFTDNERNMNQLKRHKGDIERTIAALVKLGPSEQPQSATTAPTVSTSSSGLQQTSVSAPPSATISLNPFDQMQQRNVTGQSYGNAATQGPAINSNPWQDAMSGRSVTGLEQSFTNMQVSQPVFQSHAGVYAGQAQYMPQTVAQPNTAQQYPMTNSPVNMNNPFVQAPLSAHSTGSNPYAPHMQTLPTFAPSTNPFLNAQSDQSGYTTSPAGQGFNPFGLPPQTSPIRAQTQPPVQQTQSNPFALQSSYIQSNHQTSIYGAGQYEQQQQQQFMQSSIPQSPPGLPNFNYGQPQTQSIVQEQQQPQMTSTNPYFQIPQQQQQQQQSPMLPAFPQQYQQQQQQQPLPQAQPMIPQQTSHLDKRSILALYNLPQLAPPKPLASIPEPVDEQNQPGQQVISPTPSDFAPNGGMGNHNSMFAKRSATMPVSSMHSASSTGSRNPFLMNSANNSTSSTPVTQSQPFGAYTPQGPRHTSHESMAVNNQSLQDGRHSPDAFAGLSAKYVRS